MVELHVASFLSLYINNLSKQFQIVNYYLENKKKGGNKNQRDKQDYINIKFMVHLYKVYYYNINI